MPAVTNALLATWRYMVPRDESSMVAPLDDRLGPFFRQAYRLVDSDPAALQEVIRRLSGPGLCRVKELCDRILEHPSVTERILMHEVLPFLKLLAHPVITNLPSLEDHLRYLYSFIGHNAVRFGDIFDLLVNEIPRMPLEPSAEGSEPWADRTELLRVPIIVLSRILDYSTDASASEKMKDVASKLAAVFMTEEELDGSLRAELVKHLRRIDRRLSLGLNVDDIEQQSGRQIDCPRFVIQHDPPGGRHDNDHSDICNIQILPTLAETQSVRPEYLPTFDPDTWHTAADDALAGLIDRSFRLFREDSVGPLREAVRQTLAEVQKVDNDVPRTRNNAIRTLRYNNVRVVRVDVDPHVRGLVFEVTFDPPVQFQKQKSATPQETRNWWSDSRRLNSDALVCLLDSNIDGDLLFCTVLRQAQSEAKPASKDDKLESTVCSADSGQLKVRLSVTSPTEHSTRFIYRNLPRLKSPSSYTLVEFPGVLLPAFEPVLRALQLKKRSNNLPLATFLTPPSQTTSLMNTGLPAYARRRGFRFDMKAVLGGTPAFWDPQQPFDKSLFAQHSTLDDAQGQAVVSALTNQLALIQGPPGTGKSYCGVGLIRVLLDSSDKQCPLGPILVVCYTNHALDQMLEHLLDAKVDQIIRIGSRSKSELLVPLNLNQVVREQGLRTKMEKHEAWKLKEEIQESQRALGVIAARIASAGSWESIRHHAEAVFPGVTRMLEGLVDSDGFVEVHQRKKSVNQKFMQWLRTGSDDTADHKMDDYLTWVDEIKEPLIQRYHRGFEEYLTCQHRLDKVKMEEQLRCLQQAKIVGVTSSGLARNIELLQNLNSKVIMIEEAGELLEPHTLTSLLPSIEHAILIGDHLQLRPQITNYDLSRESSQGARYALDVSLFERLAAPAAGVRATSIPFSSLETQRRMHPSISALIRDELYPSLKDAPAVKAYDEVAGIRKRLFWIDHDFREASADEDQSTSHWNSHEVEMTLALVSHLIKQGVYRRSEGIAVITPYLGQLQRLRKRMQTQFGIVVSERDETDLVQHGLVEADEACRESPQKSSMLQAVRLATVDNFQGEEADVVVVSLVRSNLERRVGFLKTSNRINVLLSRARQGMFIIGNAETAQSVPFWAKTVDKLRALECLGPSLELVCPRHQSTSILVSRPTDFAVVSPEGGCQRICEQRMNCGHTCTRACHSDLLHAAVECLERCRRMLPCQHPCLKQCFQPCEKRCKVPIDMAPDFCLPCGHHLDTLECRYVHDVTIYRCRVVVERTLACKHRLELQCHVDVSSGNFRCPSTCGALLSCGHACKRPCQECRVEGQPEHHGQCQTRCGRNSTSCSHSCQQSCHGEASCPPCQVRCENRCEHSQCSKLCSEPCAPCLQETCAVGCEHGACTLPCAVPCARLPCSRRCTKNLPCNHQCPSLCSEPCPASIYCQVCADERIKNMMVDYIIGETYGETNIDEDPIIVLLCGHLITMRNLDGHMDMGTHYRFGDDGAVVGLIGNDAPFSSKELRSCPTCRGTVTNVRRYSRITRRAALDQSTKKFVSWANASLVSLVQTFQHESDRLARNVNYLSGDKTPKADIAPYFTAPLSLKGGVMDLFKALRTFQAKRHTSLLALHAELNKYRNKVRATEQPFRRVWDLVEHLRARGTELNEFRYDATIVVTNFEIKATALLIRSTLALMRDLLSIQRKALGGVRMVAILQLDQVVEDCKRLIDAASEAKLPRETVEGHIFIAILHAISIAANQAADSEALRQEAVRHLDEADVLMISNLGSTAGLSGEAEEARLFINGGIFYQTVTSDEMREVYAAMAREFSGTGHWYRCENGHPFTIGECGMPMEQARCPECGAEVGGTDHRAVQGVQHANDLEQRFDVLRI